MQNKLKETFDYVDGTLVRKKGKGSGKPAGNLHKDGYIQVHFDGKGYRMHQLVWLYHYGYIPVLIDHVDRNRSNNNIENLRASDKQLNAVNTEARKANKLGLKGVFFNKQTGKYLSYMSADSNHIHIGVYLTKIEAALNYNINVHEWYGEHAILNDLKDLYDR